MSAELTIQAAAEYQRLISERMTPAMAAEHLKAGRIILRSFDETLRAFYPRDDPFARLAADFQAASPKANAESVSRKVRNWLSGHNRPTNREGRDVVYAWFLRTGRSYLQAREFFAALPPI